MTSAAENATAKEELLGPRRHRPSLGDRLRASVGSVFAVRAGSVPPAPAPPPQDAPSAPRAQANAPGDAMQVSSRRRSSDASASSQPGRSLTARPPASLVKSAMPPANLDRLEPELHVIGQIAGFRGTLGNAFCAFKVVAGPTWDNVAEPSYAESQTQVDYGSGDGDDDPLVWNHPIEAHFFTTTLQGWPRIHFQLFSLDDIGGRHHHGYSVCNVPTTPGHHVMECSVWRPLGTVSEEVASFFLGLNPQLRTTEILFDTAQDERCKITTMSVGVITVSIDVILRNFDFHKVEW
ncbi:B9 domain-containing protein 2 [Plasmodiophora brassicae]